MNILFCQFGFHVLFHDYSNNSIIFVRSHSDSGYAMQLNQRMDFFLHFPLYQIELKKQIILLYEFFFGTFPEHGSFH